MFNKKFQAAQVGVLFFGDKERAMNYFMDPENTNHVSYVYQKFYGIFFVYNF